MAMCICIQLMLIYIAVVEGKIEWKVERKVTAYGQDLVLFCEIENCCSAQAGWSVGNTPIYLDVRHLIENAKYDAGINRTGIALIIKRLTKDDLNKTYFCTHGFEDSTKKVLGENDAFLSPVQERGKEPLIIAVCVVVIVITIIVTSIVVCIWWKRRKNRSNTREDKGNRVEIPLTEKLQGNKDNMPLLPEKLQEALPTLIAGASFTNQWITAKEYAVMCKIEVHNHTKFDLIDPSALPGGGKLESSPVIVLSGHSEMFVAHKRAYTATGTYGTASWLLKEKKTRVVLMWSCPFNFDFYKNWLAVGLTSTEMVHDKKWFKKMYDKKKIFRMKYDLKQYDKDIKQVEVEDKEKMIKVTGTMGSSHHTTVDIRVISI